MKEEIAKLKAEKEAAEKVNLEMALLKEQLEIERK